ncbi:hypothetical protein AX14_004829 [Amanita brunnescens Koide BX004]|nr:hypothetical protein AX14_004829 [Amanita brunnescens Koide BX004]
MSNPTRVLRRNIRLTTNAPPSIVRAAKQRKEQEGPKQEKKTRTSGQRNDNGTESFEVQGEEINRLEDKAQPVEGPNLRMEVTSDDKHEDGLAEDATNKGLKNDNGAVRLAVQETLANVEEIGFGDEMLSINVCLDPTLGKAEELSELEGHVEQVSFWGLKKDGGQLSKGLVDKDSWLLSVKLHSANERAKGSDENICDPDGMGSQAGHGEQPPQCLGEAGEQPVKRLDDDDRRKLHSTVTGLVPPYGEESKVSDEDNSDPISGNDEDLDELENQAGHVAHSGEHPFKGLEEDNLRNVTLHPTANGIEAPYEERSKPSDGDSCDLTSPNAEVSDDLESQAGHMDQSPKGLGEEGERPFMGQEESDDLKNLHSTLEKTKLVAQRGEMSKEAGYVPLGIPQLELSAEIQFVTPIPPRAPAIGPTASSQALPIAFLEYWGRIEERVGQLCQEYGIDFLVVAHGNLSQEKEDFRYLHVTQGLQDPQFVNSMKALIFEKKCKKRTSNDEENGVTMIEEIDEKELKLGGVANSGPETDEKILKDLLVQSAEGAKFDILNANGRLKWSTVVYAMVEEGVFLDNYPYVPMPQENRNGKNKGIQNLCRTEQRVLIEALCSKVNQCRFIRLPSSKRRDIKLSRHPLIVFAPPSPGSLHELGKRYFWNRTIDWEGYPKTSLALVANEDSDIIKEAKDEERPKAKGEPLVRKFTTTSRAQTPPRLRSQVLGKRNNSDSEMESERKRQRVKGEPIVRKLSAPFKARPKSTRAAKNHDENNIFGARREPKLRTHSSSKSREEQEDGTGARQSQVPQRAAFRSDLAGPSREMVETEQRPVLHIERAEYGGHRDPTARPPQFQAHDGYRIDEEQNWIPSWGPRTWSMTGPSRLNRRFLAEHHGAMHPGSFHPQQYCRGDGPPIPWATQNVQFNQGTDSSQPPEPYWQTVAQGEETRVHAQERYYNY